MVGGSRALPYVAPGALEQFRDPGAGVVLGYRERRARTRDERLSYAAFEEVFRGPEERVRERQRIYVELLADHEPVLDAGCGAASSSTAAGARRREHGGRRGRGDGRALPRQGSRGRCSATANEYLERARSDGELGAVFSAQVVEHIPYGELARFLQARRTRGCAPAACSSPRP